MAARSDRADREERRRVLVTRLVELRTRRPLSRDEICCAAATLEVGERTAWRWVAAYKPRGR